MNFTTHNQTTELVSATTGTCLQGEINCAYSDLVDLFGKPYDGDGYKVDAEWVIRFDDGQIATIYNWKNGVNYLGNEGTPTEQITDWHIGGDERGVVNRIRILLDLHKEKRESGEQKDEVDKAFESCFEMMDSIRAAKGEDYAQLVQVAMLSKKRTDLLNLVLGLLVREFDFPAKAANALNEIDALMASQIIGKFAMKVEGFDFKKDAEEIIGWADKIMKHEHSAGEQLIGEALAKRKKGKE